MPFSYRDSRPKSLLISERNRGNLPAMGSEKRRFWSTTFLSFVMALCITLALALVAWGGRIWFVGEGILKSDRSQINDWGALGSYLQGTTASVWALAGLLIIFVAFLAQMRQLHLQQHQFERQSFESSFFKLVEFHDQIVSEMREVNRQKDWSRVERRECFKVWYDNFRQTLASFSIRTGETNSVAVTDIDITAKYQSFYDQHQDVLGHYFRNLYHVFKFVKNSALNDKRRYTSLARAHLSQYELALLFYNCLIPVGAKFKPLVEEFGLLENLDLKLLVDPEEDPKKYYEQGAFR